MTQDQPTQDQAEQATRAFFETFSTGDVAAILDALTDDVTWTVSGKIEGMSGPYDNKGSAPSSAEWPTSTKRP